MTRAIEKKAGIKLDRIQIPGFEMTEEAPVKGKRKSKKDKLREAAAREKKE